jgi:phospholipid/cholesterol/gamma-HCH transport system substrate-binding protein
MNHNAVETVMGAVVLVVAAVFLFFAYSTSRPPSLSGYDVTARFDRVDGLRDGGDVRISGIKVGTVVSQTLDPQSYLAIVHMNIDTSVKLPVDTIATITATGLLGDNYLALVPGGEDEYIKPGGQIEHTEAAINLFSIINKYIGGGSSTPAPPSAPAPAPAQSSSNGQKAPPK